MVEHERNHLDFKWSHEERNLLIIKLMKPILQQNCQTKVRFIKLTLSQHYRRQYMLLPM